MRFSFLDGRARRRTTGAPKSSKNMKTQNTDTVSLASLSMPDDKEQMTPPAVGDEVNYQVTGKVTAINGDMATIERTSINGQDCGCADEGGEPAEAGLQAEAQQLDTKGFGAQ